MFFRFGALAALAAALSLVAVGGSPTEPYGLVVPLNISESDYRNATTHGLEKRQHRHEIPWFISCHSKYKFFFKQWLVQAPPTWWRVKYGGDGIQACEGWKREIMNSNKGGGTIWQECADMGNVQHLSGAPYYLHMRFTTAVWIGDHQVEAAINSALDVDHWRDDPRFNNIQVACAEFTTKCKSSWWRGGRCVRGDGAMVY